MFVDNPISSALVAVVKPAGGIAHVSPPPELSPTTHSGHISKICRYTRGIGLWKFAPARARQAVLWKRESEPSPSKQCQLILVGDILSGVGSLFLFTKPLFVEIFSHQFEWQTKLDFKERDMLEPPLPSSSSCSDYHLPFSLLYE